MQQNKRSIRNERREELADINDPYSREQAVPHNLLPSIGNSQNNPGEGTITLSGGKSNKRRTRKSRKN